MTGFSPLALLPDRDDNLAASMAGFDVAQRRRRLLQWEHLIDHWPERSGFDEFLQHAEVRVIRLREVPAYVVAHERWLLLRSR